MLFSRLSEIRDAEQLHLRTVISEFYQLRRTAIKDIAAYLGFLTGFIGSAPFAWGLLAVQLDGGRFARGLWYFFGIVTTAGIFAGIAGLGLGMAAGLVWEHVHRYRRSGRGAPAGTERALQSSAASDETGNTQQGQRLHLVTVDPPQLPNLMGRRVAAIRFAASSVELDFGGIRITVAEGITIACGESRVVYPAAGSRDALCSAIGARVTNVRHAAGERFEVALDNGCALLLPRQMRESEQLQQAHG